MLVVEKKLEPQFTQCSYTILSAAVLQTKYHHKPRDVNLMHLLR